jgi:hypothetical protein
VIVADHLNRGAEYLGQKQAFVTQKRVTVVALAATETSLPSCLPATKRNSIPAATHQHNTNQSSPVQSSTVQYSTALQWTDWFPFCHYVPPRSHVSSCHSSVLDYLDLWCWVVAHEILRAPDPARREISQT